MLIKEICYSFDIYVQKQSKILLDRLTCLFRKILYYDGKF